MKLFQKMSRLIVLSLLISIVSFFIACCLILYGDYLVVVGVHVNAGKSLVLFGKIILWPFCLISFFLGEIRNYGFLTGLLIHAIFYLVATILASRIKIIFKRIKKNSSF